jgi:acyl-CoA thioesterase-1
MRRAVTAVAVMLSILLAQSSAAATMKRILVFGDSLSEGLWLKPTQAYPALLLEKLRTAGLSFEITNASQSGGTTEDGLRRLAPHLKKKIDIFILELGVNDVFHGVPIDQIRNNLQEIIDRVKRANPEVRVIICGMQLPNYTADDYVYAFGQMYANLAAKNGATLVPYLLIGVAGDPARTLPDHLHPNSAGQRVMAETVWHALEPIAREVAKSSQTQPMPSP